MLGNARAGVGRSEKKKTLEQPVTKVHANDIGWAAKPPPEREEGAPAEDVRRVMQGPDLHVVRELLGRRRGPVDHPLPGAQREGNRSGQRQFRQEPWGRHLSSQPVLVSPGARSLSVGTLVAVSDGRGSTFGLI